MLTHYHVEVLASLPIRSLHGPVIVCQKVDIDRQQIERKNLLHSEVYTKPGNLRNIYCRVPPPIGLQVMAAWGHKWRTLYHYSIQ